MTLEEATKDYVDNKVDYNITAFQQTEIPALMDLANDSFQAGYNYALSICQQEIDEACKKQREICADKVNWIDADHSLGVYNSIINAPSPKEKL